MATRQRHAKSSHTVVKAVPEYVEKARRIEMAAVKLRNPRIMKSRVV
jgi:hypothetical protein